MGILNSNWLDDKLSSNSKAPTDKIKQLFDFI